MSAPDAAQTFFCARRMALILSNEESARVETLLAPDEEQCKAIEQDGIKKANDVVVSTLSFCLTPRSL